jgi:hypothetical protein
MPELLGSVKGVWNVNPARTTPVQVTCLPSTLGLWPGWSHSNMPLWVWGSVTLCAPEGKELVSISAVPFLSREMCALQDRCGSHSSLTYCVDQWRGWRRAQRILMGIDELHLKEVQVFQKITKPGKAGRHFCAKSSFPRSNCPSNQVPFCYLNAGALQDKGKDREGKKAQALPPQPTHPPTHTHIHSPPKCTCTHPLTKHACAHIYIHTCTHAQTQTTYTTAQYTHVHAQ